jgi:hypothetical protein
MRRKIFISYRRQDAGANALGIGQYLEHEFGRKNVFIDVDMQAGTKFPTVLEERPRGATLKHDVETQIILAHHPPLLFVPVDFEVCRGLDHDC